MTLAGHSLRVAADEVADPDVVRLSVVIPHYNHGELLPRAIASVLEQGFEGCEIVVVDDGSDPACQLLLDHLEKGQPAVRVIRHGENRGAPAALNTGLSAARGPLVSFLGADDLVLAGLYETMADALDRHPRAAFACGEIAIAGDDGTVRGIRPMTAPALRARYLSPALIRRRIRKTDNWICNTATVYRTEILRQEGGFDESLGAFCDGFAVRLLAFERGFVFVPGLYGVWRVAPDTLSATSILGLKESGRLAELARERLAASQIGRIAPDYPDTYWRRLRFSAARMQFVWKGRDADPESVRETAGLAMGDRRVLAGIKRSVGFGAAGRMLALGWLAMRLRPFALAELLVHMARNQVLLRRNTKRIRDSISRVEMLGRRLTIEK